MAPEVHDMGYARENAWHARDELKAPKAKAKPAIDCSRLQKGTRLQAEADAKYWAAEARG